VQLIYSSTLYVTRVRSSSVSSSCLNDRVLSHALLPHADAQAHEECSKVHFTFTPHVFCKELLRLCEAQVHGKPSLPGHCSCQPGWAAGACGNRQLVDVTSCTCPRAAPGSTLLPQLGKNMQASYAVDTNPWPESPLSCTTLSLSNQPTPNRAAVHNRKRCSCQSGTISHAN
jgi:hypothetical protein